ncbi:ARF guanine-nucleotide exchange factor GNOM [Forsythia ovata]|uniref:ARF guanine-nucleotide exchange factor GNOM n=1 Tax=Forsythia ovata TaxID=205694 RepID=A0ABD1WUF8_9LAMI
MSNRQTFFANRDAALVLSYAMILLNTDLHNAQVKKKMREEDFIRNNRNIIGGNDLPREFLSELYHSIRDNEIRMVPEQAAGATVMTRSHWIGLVHKARETAPFIVPDCGSHFDYDMFAIISGPSIAAISVVFDNAEQEDVLRSCIDGFLSIAKLSASYNFGEVLNDLVASLCKFTTLTHQSFVEEFILDFGDDIKAKMATVALFTIANCYGDHIHSGWRNIADCILSLEKLGLLPARLASDAADDLDSSPVLDQATPADTSSPASQVPAMTPARKSSGLMGRFSLLLSLDTEEPAAQPTEQLAARRRTLHTIQDCHIDSIFAESKFLQAESLAQLVHALVLAGGRASKGNNYLEDEDTAVFCLELLIAITLNNRDRIMLLWQNVYEHTANVVQSIVMPCALVEKAVFGSFSESRVGHIDRSVRSLDLVAGSIACLVRWFQKTQGSCRRGGGRYKDVPGYTRNVDEAYTGAQKVCSDSREEIRNHAIVSLQRCLNGIRWGGANLGVTWRDLRIRMSDRMNQKLATNGLGEALGGRGKLSCSLNQPVPCQDQHLSSVSPIDLLRKHNRQSLVYF